MYKHFFKRLIDFIIVLTLFRLRKYIESVMESVSVQSDFSILAMCS